MAKEVIMPKAGMDMKEGVIIRWLAAVGDAVKEGDALLEIETDKVTMEVESPADGVLLARYFEDGATVPVVTVIGYVGEAGEKIPDAPGAATGGGPAVSPAPARTGKDSGFDYDVAVIGGGPAGYVAAIRAAQLGGKVVLFEKDVPGGTCLNRGCIPTKTYLKTAEHLRHIRAAAERGIRVDTAGLGVDMAKVLAHKDGVVKKLTGGVAALLKSWGVERVDGAAALDGANSVVCGGRSYTAASVLLCGGSRPGTLPVPGMDGPGVLNSDDILQLARVPASLAVIGGGVIGCEMATAFAAFGSRVTIVELMDRPVPMFDREVSQAVRAGLEKAGIAVLTGKKLVAVEDGPDGVTLRLEGGESVAAETALLSVGRTADLSCLGGLAGEIAMERGRVAVDAFCRTSIPNIYACGDITAVSALAHSAFRMGIAAAANAMGGSERADLSRVPSCLYTAPEAAAVGLAEEEARAAGRDIAVGRFPFAANGRALASGEPEGFVKVVVDRRFGEILGVHIVGGPATEMIAEAKALMDAEIPADEAAEFMHAHPTYSEALMEALDDAYGRCVHLPKR